MPHPQPALIQAAFPTIDIWLHRNFFSFSLANITPGSITPGSIISAVLRINNVGRGHVRHAGLGGV